MYTNFFEIINRPDWALYQYHVDFDPTIESRVLRCGLLKQHDALFRNVKAFDGMTLFSMTKLEREVKYCSNIQQFMTINIQIFNFKGDRVNK